MGNPPYITVKDAADHRSVYRSLYSVCRGKFQLTVPFITRFFELARPVVDHAGFVGLLVSNSFMKRDFGRTLIEDFLSEIDLTHVLDTSGVFIPGQWHADGSPIGPGAAFSPVGRVVRRPRHPRGERATMLTRLTALSGPRSPAQIDEPGSESEWIQVNDIDRQRFTRHPWSLAGASADDVAASYCR